MAQLEHAVTKARDEAPEKMQLEASLQDIRWLAQSNYQLELPREAEASEVVIFPQTSNESHGIEDLRMVRFVDDDGKVTYYGTCTAFDGYRVLPQLIETRNFLQVGVHTINGACAQNKGMALFPRRIGGHYAMCSRIDGENLYIMFSDIVHFWESAELLETPRYPWEFVANRHLRLALGNAARLAAIDPTVSDRCAHTASAPCCWTSTTRGE